MGHWHRRRCRLKAVLFLGLAAILFSGAEILTILVEGLPYTFPCNYCESGPFA